MRRNDEQSRIASPGPCACPRSRPVPATNVNPLALDFFNNPDEGAFVSKDGNASFALRYAASPLLRVKRSGRLRSMKRGDCAASGFFNGPWKGVLKNLFSLGMTARFGYGFARTGPRRGYKTNPPYPPLTGGQEKAKPLCPAGAIALAGIIASAGTHRLFVPSLSRGAFLPLPPC